MFGRHVRNSIASKRSNLTLPNSAAQRDYTVWPPNAPIGQPSVQVCLGSIGYDVPVVSQRPIAKKSLPEFIDGRRVQAGSVIGSKDGGSQLGVA